MKSLLKIISCIVLITTVAQAQFDNIYYDNVVYVDYIKSIQFKHKGLALSIPLIDLNSTGRLELQFDDMEGDYKNYTYHVIHCDKDWYPSGLEELEYMEGFNGEEIDDFAYSVNGYSDYTNYSLVIPNDDFKWTISGNYLLVIYDQDLEIPIITRQFIVSEAAANVFATFEKPDNLLKLRSHHELKVSVDLKNLRSTRPLDEIYLTVMQNGNTNSALYNLKPTFLRSNVLYFDTYDGITFPAIKEFRNCDLRTLKSRGEFVSDLIQEDGTTYVVMDTTTTIEDQDYYTIPDLNGAFFLDNKDNLSPKISSEYIETTFTFDPELNSYSGIYLVGAFTDWQATDKYKFSHDPRSNYYSITLSLKQGYYDYMIGAIDEDGIIDIGAIEGNWYEAENEYQAIAYYRAYGGEYDRVIGLGTFNSNPR